MDVNPCSRRSPLTPSSIGAPTGAAHERDQEVRALRHRRHHVHGRHRGGHRFRAIHRCGCQGQHSLSITPCCRLKGWLVVDAGANAQAHFCLV